MFDKVLDLLSSEIAAKIIEMTGAKVAAGLAGRQPHASAALVLPASAPKRRGRPPAWMATVKRRGRPPGSKNKVKEIAAA